MKIKLSIATFVILASSVLFTATSALAQSQITIPSFPSCPNPGGTLKASYSTGTHGIPGLGEFAGSDSVYTQSETTLVQCFCAPNGAGTQTNWWKVSSLSHDQVAELRAAGWIFIPTGLDWGLEDQPYLAKNISFNCNSGSSNGGSGGSGSAPVCDSKKPGTPTLSKIDYNGSSATLYWTAVSDATHYTIAYGTKVGDYQYGVPNTGNVTSYTIGSLNPGQTYYFVVRAVNNCQPGDFSSNSGTGGGEVLGASTFAATGTYTLVFGLLAGGVALGLLSVAATKYHA